MIARTFLAAYLSIDTGIHQELRGFRTEQQMIEAQPGIARPSVPKIIPERVHRFGVQSPDRVDPALIQQAPKRCARLRLDKRIVRVGFRRIDVLIRRHDVVVAGKHDRHARRMKLGRVADETFHPGELVGEFRTGLRVSVRRIERGHDHPVHGRFDVAALFVVGIARQLGLRDDRLGIAGEDRDTVPRLLAAQGDAVSCFLDRRSRKLLIRRLQLLE
jgi:hypothetical protein